MKEDGQQEDGFQVLSDGTALENKMSLVSMAANETALCIHIRQCRQKHGRVSVGLPWFVCNCILGKQSRRGVEGQTNDLKDGCAAFLDTRYNLKSVFRNSLVKRRTELESSKIELENAFVLGLLKVLNVQRHISSQI